MADDNHRTYVYIGLGGENPLVVGAEPPNLDKGGVYRRGDGEEEWTNVSAGLPNGPQVRAMMVHPKDPKVLFAGTQNGVFRSGDRGQHWEKTDSPDGEVWSIAVNPKDPNIMFAGYDRSIICRSQDGGSSWQKMNTANVVFPHITMHPTEIVKRVIGISVDPGNPDDVYGAIEVGGLVASRDGGENWESVTEGHYTRMGPVDLHGVQVNPSAPGLVYIITQVAMFRSRQRGSHWEFVPIEEMFEGGSYCRDLVVAPDDPKTMYLAAGAGGGSAPPGTEDAGVLVRSQDSGETWERMDLGETAPSRMFQIAIDPAAPSNIYCCTRDGLVYSSKDKGGSWSKSQVPGEMSRTHHVYPMVCG
jgi:photosystem II stability/assembly factor-like uncharacterized protein